MPACLWWGADFMHKVCYKNPYKLFYNMYFLEASSLLSTQTDLHLLKKLRTLTQTKIRKIYQENKKYFEIFIALLMEKSKEMFNMNWKKHKGFSLWRTISSFHIKLFERFFVWKLIQKLLNAFQHNTSYLSSI